jgi:tetratricopeptide (TPR) repeat protein
LTREEDQALRRCLDLRGRGDLAGALEAARQASAASPEAPVPHYAQGEICRDLRDDAGAVLAFAEALKRAPGWADAWVNLGLARYRQGSIWSAKAAMREALRVAPGHAAASGNLGALMRISGEAEAAEALLRETLTRRPENEGARLNLAGELLHRERGAEALALLEAVPSALPQWHLARILALLQLGRAGAAGEALAAFDAGKMPPELAPLMHWRHVLLARLQGDAPRAMAAALAMEAAIPLMGPNAVLEHRIMAHYDLAHFFYGRGDARSAFAHWAEGHGLLRLSQPFSRARFLEFIDSTITRFDAARFAGVRARNFDPAPVFIVGMPRSGTSLCEQILAMHRDVHGAGERAELARLAEVLGRPQRITALDKAALDAAAARYLKELHALAPEKSRIIDKMPGNELHLGLVGLMLPGARIIHCVRDPRDIGFSIWTFRFHGEHPYAHDMADLGWTIGQRERLMAHWRKVLPNPILTVALHDWVRDFDGTLARVLCHLDLPPDAACERFYESERDVRTVSRAQVRQPVHGRGLGRWRAHAAHLTPLIAELEAAGLLAAWDPA